MSSEQMKKVGLHAVIEIPKKAAFSGNFSKVYFGRFDNKEVAVKRIDNDDDDDNLARELDLLRDFQHQNIVRYLFTDVGEDYLYIVLEKCKCTLREFINEKKEPSLKIPEMPQEIPHLTILWQTVCGLNYLHSVKNIVHRDLKPPNVLLNFQDGQWIAKLSDFGISKKIDRDKTKVTQTKIRGTVGYQAPETLRGDKIDKKADVFSLGIIFYYVMSEGEHPLSEDNLKVEMMIRDGAEPTIKHLKLEYTNDAPSLILSMIAHDRENRLHITEVLAHHLFWDAEKKLSFIQDVSDYCITNFGELSPKLEEHQAEIVGDWRKTLYEEHTPVKQVFEDMRHKKQKNGVCDLLRNIRNLKHHYNEKSEEFRNIVGSMPDGVADFFTSRFPKLLPYVYDVMKCHRQEFNFKKYYEYTGPPGIDLNRSPSQQDGPDKAATSGAGYQNLSGEENEKLELREYQWELAENALKGSNSLIVAPTGSGKTAVLAGIIQHHLSVQNPNGRVMFMVPKTALAHQQYLFLSRYLPYTVEYIIGELAPIAPPGQKILENKVSVLTAQILINELTRKPEESYISFDKITMLIFDECHNAAKKHPYRQIMDLFFDYSLANPGHAPIQIVGVTASPGVGKAKDRTKVKENLLELLANLDITTAPTVVEKNLAELKTHQNEIGEYYVRVETETEFGEKIMEVMKVAEEGVKKINEESGATDLNKIPKDRYKQSYEKWTDDLKQYAKLKMRDQEAARILITYAEHLKMYNILLQLKNLVPNAMQHTNKMVTFQQEGFENKELFRRNEELLKKATSIKVPMLDRLVEIIRKEFSTNPDARCIIFVKRVLTAESLEECMTHHKEISHLNPRRLIGTHNSGSKADKPTKTEQENVLKAFRDGETKVVIATSVAEEGLDIKECNLVIMYNYVTGEVGRIQRRGRGRAADSRAILITSVGSDHLRLEEDNIIRAKSTENAIQDVKSIPPKELEHRIKEIQSSQLAERKKMDIAAKNANKGELPSKWEIVCSKCKNFLTTGDKLRHIENTHVVVKDPNFESRVIRKEKEQRKGPHVLGTADFNCNNPKCGIKVALEMVYKQARYPTLSIKKVLMRKDDGTVRDPKQRSLMPFNVTKSIDDSDNEDGLEEDISDLSLEDVSFEDVQNLSFGVDSRVMEVLEILQ